MMQTAKHDPDHYQHPGNWDQDFAPLSLHDMFLRSARDMGDAPCLDFMGRSFSYAQVADEARRIASGLQARGLARGDRIGLFLPNVPHYVASYYGALAAGCTIVNFSPLYTAEELAHQVADSGIRTLITLSAKALLPTAMEVLDRSSLENLIVGNIPEVLPAVKSIAYRLFKRSEMATVPDDARVTSYADLTDNNGSYEHHECDPVQEIAVLQYTGGTTGPPKGAKLTHQNITVNARQINLLDPFSRACRPDDPGEDRILGVLPFFHVFANATVLNRTINNGGQIVMLPRFDAKDALAAVNRCRITSMPGVPTMYQALLDHPALAKTDFSHMRACISGGAPLAGELKARFEEAAGARVIEGYGLTESSGVICCNPYEGENKLGSIGQVIAQTQVKLSDKEEPTKPPPDGEPGELLCKGPQIMAGYLNRPDADAQVFVDGWLRTGDVAEIDADGFIYIVDRLKDMIAVGGFKVFPSQIEEILYKNDAVKEALVIGVPDDYTGEKPRAFVTLKDGASEDGAIEDSGALEQWLNPQLGKHERVDSVVIRGELPKTMIGKLDRKALRAEVMDEDAVDKEA